MIVVTGGFGSIGAHTALALADLGEQGVVARHRKAAPPAFLERRVAVEQADLADPSRSLAPGRNPDAPTADPYLDTSRLARDAGFEPAFDVRAGVADYVAWLEDHPA